MTHAHHSLTQLLDEVAAETAAPGGGAVAAWAGALSGSLVEMAAAFANGHPELADQEDRFRIIGQRARTLREMALELADEDAKAFAPVLTARRLDRDDPGRADQIREASSSAAQPPMTVARICAELAELGAELAESGNANLVGDALAGTLLAEAACAAAARLVAINLAGEDGDPRLAEAAALTERALEARHRALG